MKLCKKLLSTLLAVIMIFSSFAVVSMAAGDSLNAASSLTLGSSYNGSITSSSPKDFYKFSISTSGRINIDLTANIRYLSFFIYDGNGTEVWKYYSYGWNSTTQQLNFNKNLDLKAGAYYFAIEKSGDYFGDYNLKISYNSANENYHESLTTTNNTLSTASILSLNTTKKGQIAQNDDRDIYKFSLTDSGRVNLDLVGDMRYLSFFVYDVNGTDIWHYYSLGWNSTTEQLTFNKDFDLSSGTYYLAFQNSGDYTGNYTFTTKTTSANESFKESDTKKDNTINTANSISLNRQYNGNIGVNDEKDFYKFTIGSTGKQKITLNSNSHYLSFFVYDENGSEIWRYYSYSWDNTTQKMFFQKELEFTKTGTYYFAVAKSGDYSGQYNFNIGNGTVSQQYTVTYNANGGSVSPSSASVTEGSSTTLPTPTKSYKITYNANGGSNAPSAQTVNLSCKGWSTSSTATSASYSCGASYKPSSNTTLYAVWNSPVSTNLSSSKPSRSGYTFQGWSTSSSATSASFLPSEKVNVSNNITLYAVWHVAPTEVHYVSYNANGGSVSPLQTMVNDGESITLPTPTRYATLTYNANGGTNAPAQGKYYFDCLGWSTSSTATSASYSCGSYYTPSGDVTLYAVWAARIPINITTSKPVRDGYTFLGWSNNKDATEGDFQPGSSGYLKGNATLYAVWEKNPTTTYKVTYNANKGSVSPSSANVTAGSSTTLPTPTRYATITYDANGGTNAPSSTKAYFNCLGWSTSSTATSASYTCGSSYKPSGDVTLYAVWESKAYTNLTTATPTRSGYKFLGWALTADAKEPKFNPNHSVQLGADDILYAVWKKVDPTPAVEYKTIFLNYKDTYSINVDSYEAYAYFSDNDNVVSVDSEGTVRANGTGSTDVYVYDTSGNLRTVYTFDVEYSWWQWILVIVLFGWIWY